MKKFLVAIAFLGFGLSAQADHHYEIQINGGLAGTSGGVTINDKDRGDNTAWRLGAEVYKSMNDNIQIGGIISLSDEDQTGREMAYTIGAVARYNLDAGDHRDSMFFGGGLTYSDLGVEALDSTSISLHLQVGKRYALSDTITYTPNIALDMAIGGDTGFDEGTVVNINLISFSGFM